MTTKTLKATLGVMLCILLLVFIVACSPQTSTATSKPGETTNTQTKTDAPKTVLVELPFLIRNSGNDSGLKLNKFYIDGFNKAFEGKYKIVVEWMPGVAVDIRTKLKVLNAASNLPALVSELAAEAAFGDLLIKNNRLVDLKPYFDAAPEWKKVTFPESVAYNTKDGKMFTTPATSDSYVGIFYNKELFTKAGISKFPETWDEFWADCETLKKAGITPISLHTTETGWSPMLMGTSYMTSLDGGKDFLTQKYPTNFDAPVFKETMTFVQKLFSYSTSDAVGGNYALAANNFCAGKTAMIPNGPWMIPSLSDTQFSPAGFDAKVGYGHFPNNTMLANQGLSYGYGVSVDHPKAVQEGTIEYLKFIANETNIRQNGIISGALSTLVPLTAEDLKQLTVPMQEYAKSVASVKNVFGIYQTQWDPIVQNEIIPANLPSLIGKQITVDQFCTKMVEGAKKYATENKK